MINEKKTLTPEHDCFIWVIANNSHFDFGACTFEKYTTFKKKIIQYKWSCTDFSQFQFIYNVLSCTLHFCCLFICLRFIEFIDSKMTESYLIALFLITQWLLLTFVCSISCLQNVTVWILTHVKVDLFLITVSMISTIPVEWCIVISYNCITRKLV